MSKLMKKLQLNEYLLIIKESARTKNTQLAYETKILKYLQGASGVPNVFYYYSDDDHNYMVLDLLGLSIEGVFNNCDKNFSLKTTIMLSEQMVIHI